MKTRYSFSRIEREDWQSDIYLKTIKKFHNVRKKRRENPPDYIDIDFSDQSKRGILYLSLRNNKLLAVELQLITENLEDILTDDIRTYLIEEVENRPVFYLLDDKHQKEIYDLIENFNKEFLKHP